MVAAPAGGAALPRPRRGTTGIFARVRALPEHRVVDRLLRSRLWIWALGALLGGIVAMQVSLLKLNSGISRAVETTTTLERQNAELETSIARLSAPDRSRRRPGARACSCPPAGDVSYLTAGPQDASRAVRRMQPPSEAAAALLANDGVVPGSLAAPPAPTHRRRRPTPTTPTDPATTDGRAGRDDRAGAGRHAGADGPAADATARAADRAATTTQTSPAGGAVAGQG